MTAKQRAARAKFKQTVAEAKRLRKKNPKLTQAQALKQAFAISYSKKRVSGYSKERKELNKRVTVEIRKKRKKSPDEFINKYRKKDAIKEAYLATGLSGIKKKAAPTKVKAKKRRSTEMHTDTKSHNVNIRVVSGIKRDTGYIGRTIIKKFSLAELKRLNPIYFQKGKDKSTGVYARKLMISDKLNSQVMVEAQKQQLYDKVYRQYVVRLISASGEIETGKRFDTIFGAADYIGKNIII